MIYWEGKTIDLDISPGVGAVALGALDAPMIVRSVMAGLAVIQTVLSRAIRR
jgi:hypothetical protein